MSAQLLDVSSLSPAILAKLQAKLNSAKNVKKTAEKTAIAPSKAEVLGAALMTDRKELVADGHKILGVGMTATRIAYGLRVLSWARAQMPKSNGQRKVIKALGHSIVHEGKDQSAEISGKVTITLRSLEETVRLAILSTFVPDVGKLDWNIATRFIRFLDGFKPAKQEMVKLDDCKTLLARVIKRDSALFTSNGKAPNRKAISSAIDKILGVSRKSTGKKTASKTAEKTADNVTSAASVAKWMIAADDSAIAELRKLLSPDVIARVATGLVAE